MYKNNILDNFSCKLRILYRYYENRWRELIYKQNDDLVMILKEYNLRLRHIANEQKKPIVKRITFCEPEIKRNTV